MYIAICDDDKSILTQLRDLLVQTGIPSEQIHTYCSASPLLKSLEKTHYDILLLDIVLNEVNGLDIGLAVKKLLPMCSLIYITGYVEYSQDIFESNPNGFLIKPITLERLNKTLDFVRKIKAENRQKIIAIKSTNGFINLLIDDIMYMESEKRIVRIHTHNEIYTVYVKLDVFEKDLVTFCRPHKSFLVNMTHIHKLNHNEIILYDGATIPIAPKRKAEMKAKIVSYLDSRIIG